ncbi:MarR family winged helix-turn-helix transcriptional regulator [Scopulibacillus cellulosilyticus]|uniref:MarR family winged helix-turn-helix transcriptional regulator n=1 Tax=Scopulibacillus cellulosilyticus TaxID=2665665 RepID=A0ABW2PXP7_9BACL
MDIRKQINVEVTGSQSHLLQILEHYGPLKMSEVADHLQISLGGATSLVDRLHKINLVERLRSDEDRRVVKVALTDKGLKYLLDLREATNDVLKHYYKKLTPEELIEFERLCRKLFE